MWNLGWSLALWARRSGSPTISPSSGPNPPDAAHTHPGHRSRAEYFFMTNFSKFANQPNVKRLGASQCLVDLREFWVEHRSDNFNIPIIKFVKITCSRSSHPPVASNRVDMNIYSKFQIYVNFEIQNFTKNQILLPTNNLLFWSLHKYRFWVDMEVAAQQHMHAGALSGQVLSLPMMINRVKRIFFKIFAIWANFVEFCKIWSIWTSKFWKNLCHGCDRQYWDQILAKSWKMANFDAKLKSYDDPPWRNFDFLSNFDNFAILGLRISKFRVITNNFSSISEIFSSNL